MATNITKEREAWAVSLLKALHLPITNQNVADITYWETREGGGFGNIAANNPLNTKRSGFGGVWVANKASKAYPTPKLGLEATVATLKNGLYNNIINVLKNQGTPSQFNAALVSSGWAQSHYGKNPNIALPVKNPQGRFTGVVGFINPKDLSGIPGKILNPIHDTLKGVEAIGAFFEWFGKPNDNGVIGIIRVVEVGAGVVLLGYGLSLLAKEAAKENVPGGKTADKTIKRITTIAMPKVSKVSQGTIGTVKKAFTPSKEQVEKITLKDEPKETVSQVEEKPSEPKPTPKVRTKEERSEAAKKGARKAKQKTEDRKRFWTQSIY
jgi:hypothetical protein